MQTPLEVCSQTPPGGIGALTVGENELGPPPTDFSVGDTAGALEAGADEGVDVVFGSSLVVLLQPAVKAPITTIADPPTMSVT
ncbi:MAG: hypothetical protein ACOYBX_09055 [Mycobacterium sp.]|jgi:hypothetical protein